MNRTGRWVLGARKLLSSTAVLAAIGVAGIGLTVAGCGGGGSPAVGPAARLGAHRGGTGSRHELARQDQSDVDP